MTRLFAFALAATVATGPLPAQTPAEAPPKPVFGADVDVVAVDVNVVDDKGYPVRGLGPEDFVLSVDGQARRVLSADFVALAADETVGEAPAAAAPAARAEFSTNEGARAGRTVVVVVDQGAIRQGAGRLVIRSVEHLLDRLGPDDVVGLVTMPGGGPQVELTREHHRVREGLRKVVGRARFRGERVSLSEALDFDTGRTFDWERVILRECGERPSTPNLEFDICMGDVEGEATSVAANFNHQADLSMKGLELLMDALQQVEGAKTVVLVSEGLRAGSGGRLRELSNRAAAARVAFFGVMVDEGSMPDPSQRGPSTSMFEDTNIITQDLYRLASLTRGEVFRTTGAPAVFERIAREMTGYYLVGFEPQGHDKDGEDHTIKVEVTKPGLTVRARRSLPLTLAGGGAEDAKAGIVSALRSPVVALEVPLSVATYVLQDPEAAERVRLLVTAEIGRGATSSSGLTVGFVLLDPKGKVVVSRLQEAEREVEREAAAPAASGAVPYLASVSVDPGVYTLKLAAVDGRGRRGTVQHRVTAALTAGGGLAMGDLLLGPPAAGADATLRPGVDVRAEGGALAGYVELYGGAALSQVKVTLDVAATPSGESLLLAPTRLSDPTGGRRVAQGLVPVSLLPAGRYVARATLSLSGRPAVQVARSFVVTPSAAGAGAAAPLAGYVLASARFDRTPLLQAEALAAVAEGLRAGAGSSPALLRALDLTARGDLSALDAALPSKGGGETPAVSFLRGLGLFARNQLPGAIAEFRAAVRARPDFVPGVVYLGAALAAGGNDREAVGAWNTALIQQSESPLVPLLLADGLLRLGRPGEAAAVLEDAGATADPGAAGRLGLAYALSGKGMEALPLLERHLGAHPDDADARFALVRLLYEPLRLGASVAPGDRDRFLRHARSYASARASFSALVAEWVRVTEGKAGS